MQSSDNPNKWVPDEPGQPVVAKSDTFSLGVKMPGLDVNSHINDANKNQSENGKPKDAESLQEAEGVSARERLVSEVFGGLAVPELKEKSKTPAKKVADDALEYLSITPLGAGTKGKQATVDFSPSPYPTADQLLNRGQSLPVSAKDGKMFLAREDRGRPVVEDDKGRARPAEVKERAADRASRDSSVKSKETSLGGRVFQNGDGNVVRVSRADGSSATGVYDDDNQLSKVTEKTKDGSTVTWTRDGESWTSDTKPPQTRTNLKFEKNGNVTFNTADGIKHIVRSDGTELKEGKGQSKFSFDDRGRIKEMQSPNGKTTRKFEYSGTSNVITKEEHTSKDAKPPTQIWTREGSSDWWTSKDKSGTTVGRWQGEFKVHNDGTYAMRATGPKAPADGSWETLRPDGQKFKEKVAADGTRSAYDSKGALRSVVRPDGHRIDSNTSKYGYINEITVSDTSKGSKVTWTRKDNGNWQSDGEKPETVKNLKFNEKSELRYSDSTGVVSRRVDGSRLLDKFDGSKVEYRKDGLVSRVASPDGAERRFQYDGKRNLTSVIDKDERGLRVWKDGDSKSEQRKNSRVSSTGDLRFELASGTKVIERASGVRSESDGGKLTRVLMPNGNKREFEYKAGELTLVTDTFKSGKTESIERYKKMEGADGKSIFRLQDKSGKSILGLDGKPQEFKDLKVTESGALKVKDKEGKERSIGLPDRLGETTFTNKDRDIKAAREALLEVMKGHLDQPRMERMQSMMKSFEDRMRDRADLRKLAHVKSNTEIEADHKKAVSETYKNLSEMVKSNKADTFYSQPTRAKLAENFMYHAQEPGTSDQGPSEERDKKGHGTCWINSATVWGLTQHPNAMADMLKQISLKGEYTTKNSGEMGNPLTAGRSDSPPRTVKFSKENLSFEKKQENEWSISAATEKWGRSGSVSRWVEGDRSPVSRIFDYSLPVLGGRPEGDVDGGLYRSGLTTDGRNLVGSRDIMYMVTGDTPIDMAFKDYSNGHLIDGDFRKSVLEKGTVLNYSPGHGMSQTLRRVNGQWCLIQDNQHGESGDRIIQRISNIERWAKGASGVARDVNEAVPYKSFKLTSGEPEFGPVKARARR